jgi:hypothetical protein
MSVTIRSGAQDDAGFEQERPEALRCSPAVVYLAAARNTYGTLAYRRALALLAKTWPKAVVMDADACGFASRADWYLRWPFIREGIDSVVVLSEADGSISQETWHELRDGMASELACWFVNADGELASLTSVHFRLYPTGVRTTRRWAHAVSQPLI